MQLKKITSFIFLLSWAFVQSLIEDFSSILFLEHSVFKQNTGEVLYKDLYKGSMQNTTWISYAKWDLKDIINLTLFAASSWFDWITSVDSDNISGATETYCCIYRIRNMCAHLAKLWLCHFEDKVIYKVQSVQISNGFDTIECNFF